MRACELNLIQEIKSWSKYVMHPIFQGFVDFFWGYRSEQTNLGNKLNANLAKLLMNGLYGKFWQLCNAWIDRPDIRSAGNIGVYTDDAFKNQFGNIFRNVGQCVQQHVGKTEHPFAMPAIAAYVTSYAREKMRALRTVAGENNCYYLVTDALFVNQDGYDNLARANLIADNELGMLRVKHKADVAEFEALHHYAIGDHKVEGSRKKSARPNEDGSFTEIQFESFESILMRKADGSVHVKPITKRYAKEYKRGVKCTDGWVKPILLME
jgi:hypothetical protein